MGVSVFSWLPIPEEQTISSAKRTSYNNLYGEAPPEMPGYLFQASGQVMGSCSGILKGKHSLAEVYKRVGKSAVCNAVFASKTGNKKRVTCSATWLQNWLNSDVARFTTGVRTCLLTNKVARCFFRGWYKRATSLFNSFCKTICIFFVARFTILRGLPRTLLWLWNWDKYTSWFGYLFIFKRRWCIYSN